MLNEAQIQHLNKIIKLIQNICRYIYLNKKLMNQTPTLLVKPYQKIANIVQDYQKLSDTGKYYTSFATLSIDLTDILSKYTVIRNYKNNHYTVLAQRYNFFFKKFYPLARVSGFRRTLLRLVACIKKFIIHQEPNPSYTSYMKKLKANTSKVKQSSYNWHDVVGSSKKA